MPRSAALKIVRESEFIENVDGTKNKGIRSFHRAADATTIAARTAGGAYVATITASDGSTIAIVEIKAQGDLDELRGRIALQAQASTALAAIVAPTALEVALDVISTPVRPTQSRALASDLSVEGLRRRYYGPEAPLGTISRTGAADPKSLGWFLARRAASFASAGHDKDGARAAAIRALEADLATGVLTLPVKPAKKKLPRVAA